MPSFEAHRQTHKHTRFIHIMRPKMDEKKIIYLKFKKKDFFFLHSEEKGKFNNMTKAQNLYMYRRTDMRMLHEIPFIIRSLGIHQILIRCVLLCVCVMFVKSMRWYLRVRASQRGEYFNGGS